MQKSLTYVDSSGNLSKAQDGILLTAEKLADLAQSDLPKAFELLSKIYLEGDLATTTLQKMFTGRHFTEAGAILRAVGGDWKRFNEIYAKGVDYQRDYAKQMFNVNNEMMSLKNSMLALGKDGFGYINTFVTGTTIGFNELLKETDSNAKSMLNMGTHVIGLGAQFIALTKILASLKGLGVAGGLLAVNPVLALVAGAVTGGIFAWQKYNVALKEARISAESFVDSMSNYQRFMMLNEAYSEGAVASLNNFEQTLDSIQDGTFFVNGLDDVEYTIASLLGKTDKWGDSLLRVAEIFQELEKTRGVASTKIELEKLTAESNAYKEQAKNSIGVVLNSMTKNMGLDDDFGAFESEELFKKDAEAMRSIVSDIGNNFGKTMKVMIDGIEKEIVLDTQQNIFDYMTQKSKEFGIEYMMNDATSFGDVTRGSVLELNNLDEQLDKLKEKNIAIKNITDSVEKENSLINEQSEALKKIQEVYTIRTAKDTMDILSEFGKVEIGGQILSGENAIISIYKDSFAGNEEALANFEERWLEFKEKNDDFVIEDKASVEYVSDYITLLSAVNKNKVKQLEIVDEIAEVEALIQELQNADSPEALAQAQKRLVLKQQEQKVLVKMLSGQERDIENLEARRKFAIEEANAEKSRGRADTEYIFKYKNYLKETLDMELERAKIGKTIGQQSILDYEYKLKQLEVSKELAKQEFDSTFDMGASKLGLSGITATKESLAKLQSMRDAITSDPVQKGDGGKLNKEKITQLDAIMSAMVKVIDLEQQIALEPLKEFNKLAEAFPSTLNNIISSISGSNIPNMNIWKDMLSLNDSDLQESIEKVSKSVSKPITIENIDKTIAEQMKIVVDAKNKASDSKGDKAIVDATKEYKKQVEHLNDMLGLKERMLDSDKKSLEYWQQMNAPISKTGSFLSQLGSIFGNDSLSGLGDIFNQFSDTNAKFQAGDMELDFGSFFKDGKFDAQAFGKTMESASAMMGLGQMGGSLLAGVFGGNSQMGGELGSIGGLVGTMVGGPVGGMIGSAIGGLAGGLFGGNSAKDQEKAQQKTNEANRLYQENTNALNKLANNMANLNTGIDSLNSSLLTSFSQIPTFDKLNNVTDALKEMNKTLISSRDFGDIAYQITKSKKSGGGLFSKGQTVQWTETHTKTLNEMLGQYGFKGSIYDMDSEQLRDFGDWLEDVKLGEQSNVEGMGQLIKDYAEAMDAMQDNIDDFFYDTTMEGFTGISSVAQEELKQQLTDFYKNLGITIDEEMQKTIDELAEEMSVMVSIMGDVRSEFLSSWKESGKSAGESFISGMKPYMEAMIGNISQIFYDVYFSDVTESLEDSFKKISEQLVEMKKQGSDLDWGTVTDSLAGEFDKVLSAIISAKQETESFNDVILSLQKQAIDAGLTLSELFELGLVTGTQGEVLDMFKDAVLSSDDDGALTAIGDFMGDKIGDALAKKLMDNLFSNQILDFSNKLDSVLSGELKFSQLAGLMSQANAIGVSMEQQRLQIEAILAGFDFSSDITYETDASKVEYSAGTSQQNTYVYNLSAKIDAGNVIESDSITSLADELIDVIIEKLKVDKGIDITKNY